MLDRLVRLDEATVIRLSGWRSQRLNALMRAATRAGDGPLWAAIAIALWIL